MLLTKLAFRIVLGLGFIWSACAQAETTFERAKRTNSARVAIYNQAPWGIRDANGEYHGFSVDIICAALERMGINSMEAVSTEFAALIPSLQARRVDALSGSLFITPERCKMIAFGNPDIKMGDGFLVRAGNPKDIHSYEDIARNPDAKIGTGRGNSTAADALKLGVPSDRQILFQDNQAAVSALIAGRIDAVSATAGSIAALDNDIKGKGIERADPFNGVRDAQGNPRYNYAGVAFNESDTDFRDAYNDALKSIQSDGTLLKILLKYGFTASELPSVLTSDLCGK
jgi:polar amino acid transport system substrate-binding protein